MKSVKSARLTVALAVALVGAILIGGGYQVVARQALERNPPESIRVEAPGSAHFYLLSAVGEINRISTDMFADISNQTTADGILETVRQALPEGVTAGWSANSPFRLTPATRTAEGRITGTLIITSGRYSTAIVFDREIPVQ